MTANNDGWIDWTWTKEKPYPESLDTMVEVRFGDGGEFGSCEVGYWWAEDGRGDAWDVNKKRSLMIVAYRVVN